MGKTKLNKKDFEEILSNYAIGEYKSHKKLWWSIDNTLYELKTIKGNFILKIFESSLPRKTKKVIKVMTYLEKNNVPIAKIYQTKKGNNIFYYKNKHLTIQEFVRGTKFKKADRSFVIEFSRVLGLISKSLLKLDISKKPPKNALESLKKYFPEHYKNCKEIDGLKVWESERKIIKEFKKEREFREAS